MRLELKALRALWIGHKFNGIGISIVPTFPFENFIDVPERVFAEINAVARSLYLRLDAKFSPDGISFIQNNGKFNDLGHYHLHVFPRFDCDKFGWRSSQLGIQNINDLRQSLAGL